MPGPSIKMSVAARSAPEFATGREPNSVRYLSIMSLTNCSIVPSVPCDPKTPDLKYFAI